jgi:hypothetical protein
MDAQKTSSMDLKSYLNLYELLAIDKSTIEEHRAFGLAKATLKHKPVKQLVAWTKEHVHRLTLPLMSEKIATYLYGVTFILLVISLLLGIISGVTLLSYNGHEPVNVVYFMAMVIFFPLFTMTMALFSMFRANSAQSVLVQLSPAYWMERIIKFLPIGLQEKLEDFQINPLLSNWIVIRRSQLIALCFSIGLLLALMAVVSTKDIAFAWSTTLHISAEGFHGFLFNLSLPWSVWLPDAVPSLELIKQSQYFRLGDRLSEEMITHASKLGEWWKFLAMSTLFYAVFLRILMYLLASLGLKKALKKSFLSLAGVTRLLGEMNEPIISTSAIMEEAEFVTFADVKVPTVHKLDSRYDSVQGWAIPKENLIVINDTMQIETTRLHEVGGGNTFTEDTAIVQKSSGEVLLYVKAWEAPTMDFMDYIEELLPRVDKLILYPVGTQEDDYKPKAKFVDIWARKISPLKEVKIWLKRAKAEGIDVIK